MSSYHCPILSFPIPVAADDGDDLSKGYDYLLGMKIWNLTMERVKMMENELEAKTEEMAQLKARQRASI